MLLGWVLVLWVLVCAFSACTGSPWAALGRVWVCKICVFNSPRGSLLSSVPLQHRVVLLWERCTGSAWHRCEPLGLVQVLLVLRVLPSCAVGPGELGWGRTCPPPAWALGEELPVPLLGRDTQEELGWL